MQTSFSDPAERSGPISAELARDALLLFYAAHREADLARMENRIAFWCADPQFGGWPVREQIDRLLQWLNVRPVRKGRRRWKMAVNITRVVTPPLNRAANNILSELLAALESKQYADAARSLIGSVPPRDEGLVPVKDDEQLFVSFRVALRLLVQEHSELAEAMDRQIGPADRLEDRADAGPGRCGGGRGPAAAILRFVGRGPGLSMAGRSRVGRRGPPPSHVVVR